VASRDAPAVRPAAADFAVRIEARRTQDFGRLAARVAPQRVHLPQPVLRRHIALDEERVLVAGGRHMRHAQRVERYRGGIDGPPRWSPTVAAAAASATSNEGSATASRMGDRDIHVLAIRAIKG